MIDEGPSPEDVERFSGETAYCPHCRGEVHDESQRCPRCGEWVGAVHKPGVPWLWKGIWLLIVLFLVLAMAGLL